MGAPRFTLAEIRKRTVGEKVYGDLLGQIEGRNQKQTRDGKPYLEMQLRDGTGLFTFRVWQDHDSYGFLLQAPIGIFVGLTGEWSVSPQYGLEVRNYVIRSLPPAEIDEALEGPAALREKQASDYREIERSIAGVRDPRLRRLGEGFLAEHGERFRRTAGARHYHHARRGGLVEHVGQMMRAAKALAGVYPTLNVDLLVCGVLFHDCGKMWENCFPKDGLVMDHDTRGELLGHIAIGIEVVNRLWSRVRAGEEFAGWRGLTPDSESVHLHLLHLVASHHGEKAFGSPVEPKTPEAMALHFIDNLDAKFETFAAAYDHGSRLTEEIIERVRPLPTNSVLPLETFVQPLVVERPADPFRAGSEPFDLPFDLPAA